MSRPIDFIQAAVPQSSSRYRRNACIFRRPKEKDENEPMVVATHEDPYSSHYRDLLMTCVRGELYTPVVFPLSMDTSCVRPHSSRRSICDWTKSAWVLPHPDVVSFDVAAGRQ